MGGGRLQSLELREAVSYAIGGEKLLNFRLRKEISFRVADVGGPPDILESASEAACDCLHRCWLRIVHQMWNELQLGIEHGNKYGFYVGLGNASLSGRC